MHSTFLRLKKYADFEGELESEEKSEEEEDSGGEERQGQGRSGIGGLNIEYTINLNLPATTNIEVFDAIFQSLRRNLLRDE